MAGIAMISTSKIFFTTIKTGVHLIMSATAKAR